MGIMSTNITATGIDELHDHAAGNRLGPLWRFHDIQEGAARA